MDTSRRKHKEPPGNSRSRRKPPKMVTKSINNSDKPIIQGVLGEDSKVYIAAASRIYYAAKGQRQWTLLKECSAFTFYQSKETGILFFCLVDLAHTVIAWKQEIYVDFKFHRETDTFYSFEGDKGTFGILFADAGDAKLLYRTVREKLEKIFPKSESMEPRKSKKKSKSRSIFGIFGFGSKSSDEEEESEQSETEQSETETETEIEDEKPNKKSSSKRKDDDLSHEDVSEPRDFTHLSHIGFNPEKGTFDIQNIPQEWKSLFAKAGITQDQLENKSTAKFIAGFVQDSDMKTSMQAGSARKASKAPPAPVPLKKKPPPPPMKTKSSPTKTAVAPPPPPKKKNNNVRAPLPTSANANRAPLSTTPPKTTIRPQQQTNRPPLSQAQQQTNIPPPPPPPPPAAAATSIPKPPLAPSAHSALLQSIQGAGIGILKSVESSSTASSVASTPKATDPHSALMSSIKSGGASLKPAPPKSPPTSPTSSVASTDPTDMMAAMLAKALAARNKKLAVDSSDDEDSDDSRW